MIYQKKHKQVFEMFGFVICLAAVLTVGGIVLFACKITYDNTHSKVQTGIWNAWICNLFSSRIYTWRDSAFCV